MTLPMQTPHGAILEPFKAQKDDPRAKAALDNL